MGQSGGGIGYGGMGFFAFAIVIYVLLVIILQAGFGGYQEASQPFLPPNQYDPPDIGKGDFLGLSKCINFCET